MATTSSSYTSYRIVYPGQIVPAEPPKPLEQMSDQEVAAAVVERLKFPFLCKSCGRRVKEVDSGGVCPSCTGWFSWGTFVGSVTSSWHISSTTRAYSWGGYASTSSSVR